MSEPDAEPVQDFAEVQKNLQRDSRITELERENRELRQDVDAIRAAIAAVAEPVARVIEALRKTPRAAWAQLCDIARAAARSR